MRVNGKAVTVSHARRIASALLVLALAVSGCQGQEDPAPPEESSPPTPEASAAAFEEMSGARIPDDAADVDVSAELTDQGFEAFIATFTVSGEEDAREFCASGGIGNYLPLSSGLTDAEREGLPLVEEELADPRGCTSVKDGERVNRIVVFSFPEDAPVEVYARTEEFGR